MTCFCIQIAFKNSTEECPIYSVVFYIFNLLHKRFPLKTLCNTKAYYNDSMFTYLCICLSLCHSDFSETVEAIVGKFRENLWSRKPFTWHHFVVELKGKRVEFFSHDMIIGLKIK